MSISSISRRQYLQGSLALGLGCLFTARAQARAIPPELHGNVSPVHDPCVIKAGDRYHLFSTGHTYDETGLLPWRTSRDLVHWELQGPVFERIPAWAQKAVPGVNGLWAPDIAFFDGRYHLYYSCSTFGSNHSAIGLVTNATLDRSSPDFQWRDEGVVITSTKADDFNAIDPNHIIDREGQHWLSLGSFWSGLKLFPLDGATGKPRREEVRKYSIASRPVPEGAPGAIEAPFIVTRGDYYYLFASYDYCCRGTNSSYYIVAGRSKHITGPYVGRDGRSMQEGYGTLILRGNRRYRGPGHCAVFADGAHDYLVYHAYDAEAEGRPTLRIAPLRWDHGWPQVEA